MSRKHLLYVGLVLAVLLGTVAAPLMALGDAPSVDTDNATNVSVSSATLWGTLTSLNSSENVTVSFIWGTTEGGPWLHSTENQTMANPGTFSAILTGLDPGTPHYFKAMAVGDGESWGVEKTFTTLSLPAPPSVTTNNATRIAPNSFTLNGTLTSTGTAGTVTVSFEWGTTSGEPYANETAGQSISSTGSFSADLTGLTYETPYYFRAKAVGDGASYGEERTFTTLANVAPAPPTNVSPANGATVSITPTLQSSDFSDPGDTHAASQWQIRTALGTVFDSGTDNVNLTSIVVPAGTLAYSTIYLWCVRHQDNNGTWSAYSAEWSFITSANQAPAQPTNVSPVTGSPNQSLTPTLTSSAFVDPDAGDSHAASQWQITTISGDYATGLVFDSGTGSVNLTSIAVPASRLSYSTTYYWRVKYWDNHTGESPWSVETSFTTLANRPPSVPTNSVPANLATGVSLTPTLQSSAFADDVWDTHVASQWQISTVAGNWEASLVWDNETNAPDLTRTVVPSGLLSHSTTYYWRVRYQDSQPDGWSQWSSPTSFTTRPEGTGADFVANVTVLIVGQSVQFTDTSTGAIVSWTWNFGDGTTPVTWSTRPSDGRISHTYSAAGSYTVALTITDSGDESYTETKPDYIHVFVLPAAGFSVSATAIVLGEAVAFTNESSGGIPPLTYAWDFDDDGYIDSTSPNPSHSYGATGTYTVSLRVTDARGNSTTETRTGYISVSNAIAPHTIPPDGGVIQTADGRIAVTFPPGAVAGETTLNIDGLAASAVDKKPDGYKLGATCFTIEAVDAGGRTVAMSSQWVTVTVKYSDEDVAAAGGKPENLVLARYNSATGKWTILDTTLNRADRTLSANTTHFSTWAVMAKKPSGGMASWIWIILGIAAGLAVAVLVGRAVAIERTGKVRQYR